MQKGKKMGILFLLITILLGGCISKEAAQEEEKKVPLVEEPQPQIETKHNKESESRVELVIGPNDIPPIEESKFKEGVFIEWADVENKMDKGAIVTLQTVLETIINQDLTTYAAQLRSDVKDSVPITGQDIFFSEDKDKKFMFYDLHTIEKVYKTKSEYYYNVVVICMESSDDLTQQSYSFVITKKDEEWKLYMVD
ncbi:hypothetical protein J45TS6_19110 [Paenibacillus sp. J45TS6]|uniref:hypothetical protein n=1 Tax=Paenibacillus sp. J45TS6 TaxID=2807196 RepID=UPI001B1930B8|nr:hypothetical protein [Paenibacillus sp. J45TS6]GIP43452.1 hypothetical protein J45TS6_19110 [Paenibacillus sp. J45TS6]